MSFSAVHCSTASVQAQQGKYLQVLTKMGRHCIIWASTLRISDCMGTSLGRPLGQLYQRLRRSSSQTQYLELGSILHYVYYMTLEHYTYWALLSNSGDGLNTPVSAGPMLAMYANSRSTDSWGVSGRVFG